jgi:hypothetical protein
MPADLTTQFSASTASITFCGKEVGELQRVSWDERLMMVRVKAIGSPIDVAHIPGQTEYDIRASRALLQADLVYALMSGTITRDAARGVTQTGANDPTPDQLTLSQLYVALTDPNYALIKGQRILAVRFGINIKDLDGKIVFQFEDCTMTTKTASMDTGGLIVMQDVTLFSRYKTMPQSGLSAVITKAQPAQNE